MRILKSLGKYCITGCISCLILASACMPAYADNIDNDILTENPASSTHSKQEHRVPKEQHKESDDNNIVYENPFESSGESTDDQYTDYAGDLFGDVKLDKDDSFAQPAIEGLRKVVSVVVTVAISFIPLWIVLNVIIDVLCILAPPIMWVFANMMPVQLFSTEVSQVTGVQFAGKDATAASQAVDLKDKNKFVWYFQQKTITSFFALFMVVLVATGIYFDILNWVINGIVGIILSLMPVR